MNTHEMVVTERTSEYVELYCPVCGRKTQYSVARGFEVIEPGDVMGERTLHIVNAEIGLSCGDILTEGKYLEPFAAFLEGKVEDE